MSKHETWRTRQYWRQTGGLLIEEFQAVPADRPNNVARRLIDGIIVLNEKTEIYQGSGYDLNGKDIIVVQPRPIGLVCT